ncbi:MAG: HAMP domain-containing sensor histidine kinase [Ktedonobacterales bacterium]
MASVSPESTRDDRHAAGAMTTNTTNTAPTTQRRKTRQAPKSSAGVAQAAQPDSFSLDDFLDLAGHELRIPITALKGQAQLLQRRLRKQEGRDAELVELERMLYQIERLNHQLGVFLDSTHITQKRLQLLPVECDLVAVAQRVATIYAAGAPERAVRLEVAPDALTHGLVGVWDRMRLEAALGELLGNALKYSQEVDIVVRLSHEGKQARVEVEDTGVGVPTADRARIFKPYQHGANVDNAGVGLGLYVTRAALRKMGGRIGLRARPGGGSIFWFTLPLTEHPTLRA